MREKPLILASSPPFLTLILVGSFITLLSVPFFVGIPTIFSCIASQTFFGIGVTLLFGSLFAKTFRGKIMNNAKKLKTFVLPNHILVRF